MITPNVKIIRLDWEKGQMCNLFSAITSFAIIKSEQCVERKDLNKKLIALVFVLNTLPTDNISPKKNTKT